MPDTLQILGLAMVQGITEFLPVSSSAHLLLFSKVLGFSDQGLAIDVAVHAGSLPAVLLYFRRQIIDILHGGIAWLTSRPSPHPQKCLFGFLCIATLPLLPAGLLLRSFGETLIRQPLLVATTTIGFACLLYYAERKALRHSPATPDNNKLSWKSALFVGIMQCFALIPGTSRAGVATTACLLLGMNRKQALEIAMLLSIPAIIAATSLISYKIATAGDTIITTTALYAAIAAFVCAYAAIAILMRLINTIGFIPFVVYRILLGAWIFWFFW